jgi:membrane protease YdiL (CAAX protease family)
MRPYKLPVSRLAFALAFVLFCYQILSSAVYTIIQLLLPDLLYVTGIDFIISYGLLYGVYIPLAYLIVRSIPNTQNQIAHSGSRRINVGNFIVLFIGAYAISYALGLGMNVFTILVDIIMNVPTPNVLELSLDPQAMVINAIAMVGIAPLFEELIFRKFLYNKLIGYGPHVYILVSSIFFMCWHTNLFQMFFPFALGIILGAVYAYTKKFRYVWAIHFLQNGISVIGVYLTTMDHPQAELLIAIYAISNYGLTAIGLGIAIWFAVKKLRKFFSLGYGTPLYYKGAVSVFLNPGMIVLYCMAAGLTLFIQFSIFLLGITGASM